MLSAAKHLSKDRSPSARDDGGRPPVAHGDIQHLLASAHDRLSAAGADSPWLTALVLLEHATRMQRAALLAHPEAALTSEQAANFHQLVERRACREPLAYILGYRDFYGRRFAVSSVTLIPRPETERLVELAIARLDRLSKGRVAASPGERGDRSFPLLDVGTGSGAIVVSVLAERPETAAVATDSSTETLAVASKNARAHGVSGRLRLVACDLASAIHAQFPVVVGNLPYIATADLEALAPEIARFEPRSALDGGPDGISVIRRFLDSLRSALAPGGTALLEIGDGQAAPLSRLANEMLQTYGVHLTRDHTGTDRFLIVERPER